MWRTEIGTRKLNGAERRLFGEAALSLADELEGEDEDFKLALGVRVFDSLPAEIRRFVVLRVARDLLSDSAPPELLAWNEATVYAIFRYIEDLVGFEIDNDERDGSSGHGADFRRLVRAAWMSVAKKSHREESTIDDEGIRQRADSKNIGAWTSKIEELSNRILWDDDFELEFLEDVSDYFEGTPTEMRTAERQALLSFRDSLERELRQTERRRRTA